MTKPNDEAIRKSLFSIFDPHNLPSPADLLMYDNTEINVLADYFCVLKKSTTESDAI